MFANEHGYVKCGISWPRMCQPLKTCKRGRSECENREIECHHCCYNYSTAEYDNDKI